MIGSNPTAAPITDVCDCHLEKAHHLLDGPAAQVHEGLGFRQPAPVRKLRHVGLEAHDVVERRRLTTGKTIQQHEPDVVTGVGVFFAWIAQADDQLE